MTVSSLWTVLDEAGCGTPVDIDDFSLRGRGDGNDGTKQTILAVDLSIWICEGITSTALSSFHSDPALHLVYQRTTKLLKLGLGLVFVIEGKRRVRSQTSTASSTTASSSQTHELKQRRSGSQFWNASKRCESLLQQLGVPVVRAEAEGEALCALLNSTGLVDGVISNDGDCLLFGAKTIYTNFSAENLEGRKVIRYNSDSLSAKLDGGNSTSSRTIKLSREDLVAFAVLCGSDMCGEGVKNVGQRKAVQFFHACRSLNHRCNDRTCLDEVLSWSDAVAAIESTKPSNICLDCDDDGPSTIPSRCCSLCLHQGDKLQHEKHGCAECGTEPGEGCYVVTSSEKFMRSVKAKAMNGGSIAPRQIVDGYFSPNSNNVPGSLSSLKSKPYALSTDAAKLFTNTDLIVKGRTRETSQEYIKQTLPKLLARIDLWDTGPRNRYDTKQKYKPIPMRIEKSLVKQSCPCYEITWSIIINPSSDDVPFQFSTCECQSLVNSNFPQLVKSFQQEERRKQQGRAEDERRKHFVGANKTSHRGQRRNQAQRRDFSKKPQAGQRRKRVERNFDSARICKAPKMSAELGPTSTGLGNDVSMLMDYLPNERTGNADDESIESSDGNECTKNFDQVPEKHNIDIENSSFDIDGFDIDEKSGGCAEDKADHLDYSHDLNMCPDIDREKDFLSSLDQQLDDILDEHAWGEVANSKDMNIRYGDDAFCSSDLHQDDTQYHCGDLHNSMPDGVYYGSTIDEDVVAEERKQPFQDEHLNDHAYDGFGYDDVEEYLRPSDTNQYSHIQSNKSKCMTDYGNDNMLSNHLSPSERIFCDMGSISIEVTPIVSRRWRRF